MSKSESSKIWIAVIGILVISGLVAAIWPLLATLGPTGSTGIPVEIQTVTIKIPPIPAIGFGGFTTEINSFLLLIILAVVVVGSVVVAGVIITLLIRLLSRFISKTEADESFQQKSAKLEKNQNDKLKAKQSGNEAVKEQQNDYMRWAVIATSVAILFFVAIFGLLLTGTLFPTGEIIERDEVFNIGLIITGAFLLVTLLLLLFRMNPKKLAAVDTTDNAAIPWETIAVLLTGVIVLGLGIGLMIYFNTG